ncbi:MAG TPA: hypothetical protein VK762_05220 [Polyangiaceae bacterium]|nr:hypothetical protein [Polyangiaceae bacterium]
MRLPLAIALFSFGSLLPACFSTSVDDIETEPPGEDSGGDATTGTDATITEAGVPFATDTGTPAPEASTPDAAPTTVSVLVVNDHGPESGVTVVFQDAAGNPVATATTDASGTATQVAVAGSQVTVVMGSLQNVQIVTFEGVAPGDVLTAHDATDTTFANTQVSIDGLPDAGPPPGTGSYTVNIGPCSGSFTDLPGLVYLSPDCENRGKFPVLVQAVSSDPEDPEPIGFTYQTGNALPLDGGVAHVSLSGAWTTTFSTQSIAVSNFDFTDLTGYTAFSEIADGISSGIPSIVVSQDGSAVNSFFGHPGYATAVQSEANQSGNRGSGVAISAVATRSAPSPDGGAASFDYSQFLPLLDAVTLDSSQPGQPVVSWVTEAGSLASASGTIVTIAWNALADGGDYLPGTWTIVAPPTATSVKAPALPPAVAAWAPPAGAQFASPPNVIVVQGSFLPGYAQLRALFSTLPAPSSLLYDQFSLSGVVPPLPVDGTLKLTAITFSGD